MKCIVRYTRVVDTTPQERKLQEYKRNGRVIFFFWFTRMDLLSGAQPPPEKAVPVPTATPVPPPPGPAAPEMAGLSKIRPGGAAPGAGSGGGGGGGGGRARIAVPARVIGGGTESKFVSDPYGIQLHGILTVDQYRDSVEAINYALRPARANKLDAALLASGALMVPLVVWGARHSSQMKRRKKLLLGAIEDFNIRYPHLYMRWNRRPESILTIERRVPELHGAGPAAAAVTMDLQDKGRGGSTPLYQEEDTFV